MKNSYPIKAIIRTDKQKKKNGKLPIYFRIRLNTGQLKLPAHIDVEEQHWDNIQGRLLKGAPQYSLMNQRLAKTENEFSDFVSRCILINKPVTKEAVKSLINGETASDCFFKFYEKEMELLSVEISGTTMMVYRHTLAVLRAYKTKIDFEEISLDFIQKFDVYLRKVRGCENGGTFNRHKCFKAILNRAFKKGRITQNPYVNFSIKRSIRKTDFLKDEQIQKIEQLSLKKRTLEKYRDMFLFCCYTGFRYSDMQNLKRGNIKNVELNIVVVKTRKRLVVPVNKKAKTLTDKYSDFDRENVFDSISNQKLNNNMKIIFELAGIDKKYTFHDSRHAFACSLVRRGVTLLQVRDLMGHASIKETEIYAKNDARDLQEAVSLLDGF